MQQGPSDYRPQRQEHFKKNFKKTIQLNKTHIRNREETN